MDRTNDRPPSSLPVAGNGSATINGATPLPEASQVGNYRERPTPTGSIGGGPQGGLGSGGK